MKANMKTVFWVGIVLWADASIASEMKGNADECTFIKEDQKRLDCYDSFFKSDTSVAPGPAGKKVDSIPPLSFHILQKGDFDNFANANLTLKPATINFQRKDGQDGSQGQLGVVAVGSAFNDAGWQPFGSLAWNVDSTGDPTKKKDVRDAGFGVTGMLMQTDDLKWSLYSTLRYRYRKDIYGTKDGNAIGFHISLVKLDWVDEKPFCFVPYVGLLLDKRNGDAAEEGQWNSTYAGANLTIPLNNWIRGLSLNGIIEYFDDYSTPNGQSKRTSTFASSGIKYDFTDPEDKNIKWRPSISLSRQTGEDIRSGGNDENKTVLSLGLMY